MTWLRQRAVPVVAMGLLGASTALAHSRLKPASTLKPRDDSSSLKTAPCGGVGVDEAKRTTLAAGSQLTVKWEETIHHKGSFKLFFSQNGLTGFEQGAGLKTVDHEANPSPHATNPDIGNPATYIQFETTVTVPDVACDKCVIQLVQIMTDRTPSSNYYSCADVKIVKGDVPPPTGDDGGGTDGPSTVPPEAGAKPATPQGVTIKIQRSQAP